MALNSSASQESLVEEIHSPRKAVVFDSSPETTLDDYFESVSKTIDPGNITHASQIRGDRVCMFFREEDNIKQLLEDGGLDIKNSFTLCQRFDPQPSRVTLSNCLPFISNKKLVDTLSQIGKIDSPITDVPVETQFDTFKHVKSFRKTVDIVFPDLDNVPTSVMVEYRTKRVPIYISVDNLLCAYCRCYGHCGAHCPLVLATTKATTEATVAPPTAPPTATPTAPSKIKGTDPQPVEDRRPRAKSAPAPLPLPPRRMSSPITSFFRRHADLAWDPGLTCSIDFSRESVLSISPKVACTGIDNVLNGPSDSNEHILKECSIKTVSGKSSEEALGVKKMSQTDCQDTYLTLPMLTSESRTRPEQRILLNDQKEETH